MVQLYRDRDLLSAIMTVENYAAIPIGTDEQRVLMQNLLKSLNGWLARIDPRHQFDYPATQTAAPGYTIVLRSKDRKSFIRWCIPCEEDVLEALAKNSWEQVHRGRVSHERRGIALQNAGATVNSGEHTTITNKSGDWVTKLVLVKSGPQYQMNLSVAFRNPRYVEVHLCTLGGEEDWVLNKALEISFLLL